MVLTHLLAHTYRQRGMFGIARRPRQHAPLFIAIGGQPKSLQRHRLSAGGQLCGLRYGAHSGLVVRPFICCTGGCLLCHAGSSGSCRSLSCFLCVCECGCTPVMQLEILIEYGADVNGVSPSPSIRLTALYSAVYTGDMRAVDLLLQHGTPLCKSIPWRWGRGFR